MARLYVSTGSIEAEALLDPTQSKGFSYTDYDISHGQRLSDTWGLGFNPMSSIGLDVNVSERVIGQIAADLVKKGLFVATEIKGRVHNYIPSDMQSRNLMCQLATGSEVTPRSRDRFFLLFYSNFPNQIKEEVPILRR